MKCLLILVVIVAAVTSQAVPDAKYCKAGKNKGELEIIMRPPSVIEVQLGDTVSVACAAHGHGMADPTVSWIKGVGPGFDEEGKNMGPVATGKSVLWIAEVAQEDIDSYQCVIQDCCSGNKEIIDIDIVVPDQTCEDVYGVGNVVYGAVWKFTNWTNALAYCEDKGMELAFPMNAEENAQLFADITASFDTHPNARKFDHSNWIWIAAHDSAVEGEWIVQKTGEPVEWFNWASKQPDNWDKFHINGQDVSGISRINGQWDDSYEFYNRPYVCLCPSSDK